MTAGEELEKILEEYYMATKKSLMWDDARKAIMSWHQQHRPQVSREAVDQIFIKYLSSKGVSWDSRMTNDLLALLNGYPVWCEHIYFHNGVWKFCQNNDREVSYLWDQCPVKGCHAPRPDSP